MKPFLLPALVGLLAVLLFAAGCGDDGDEKSPAADPATGAQASGNGEQAHWGYEGAEGPEHWAELSEEFAACEEGTEQSPIDIDPAASEAADIPDPELDWQTSDLELINNGHTIQADVPVGSTSVLDGERYGLIQFHWHRPSEHEIDGDPFAMELHFVHANDAGALAVLGVMLSEGDGNPLYDDLWAAQPEVDGSTLLEDVDFTTLLPDDLGSFTYAGSLTTPPCSEGVAWNVLETPAELSGEQIGGFAYDGNARPVQQLDGRTVDRDED